MKYYGKMKINNRYIYKNKKEKNNQNKLLVIIY